MGHRFVMLGYVTAALLLSGAGLFAAKVVHDRKKAQEMQMAVSNCASMVAREDPEQAARDDASRGEDRFYFVPHVGIAPYISADGVSLPNSNPAAFEKCYPKPGRGADRDMPFREFGGYVFKDGPCCTDADPPLTVCGMAIDRFVRRYNAELALLKPKSVAKYCESARR